MCIETTTETMNILVFNCGSSSLKYRLIEMPSERELAGGEAQRVGPKTSEPARIFHSVNGIVEEHRYEMPDHATAFDCVMGLLARDAKLTPHGLGHRLVHGGTLFQSPTWVDEVVLNQLDEVIDLAPLHNPPAIRLVKACQQRYPELPQILVFDTAFHATIPDYARQYALPRALQDKLHIRKYGFHGISHQYVCTEAAQFLGLPMEQLTAVSCHLGSGGASLCAVREGCSIDNTMGFSPLQGLIMSTRCGDLDPSITLRLLDHVDGDFQSVETILNKKSGVLGLSGFSADIRDVINPSEEEHHKIARQATQLYLWRLRKYLGAYLAVTGKPHAVIFTDTIGETVPEVRWMVSSGMEAFGLRIDRQKNWHLETYPADIAASDSAIRILVIRTNEELAIARYSFATLRENLTLV